MNREDMVSAAKFRATCERCGKRQARAATDHTTSVWMRLHEAAHRVADQDAKNLNIQGGAQ